MFFARYRSNLRCRFLGGQLLKNCTQGSQDFVRRGRFQNKLQHAIWSELRATLAGYEAGPLFGIDGGVLANLKVTESRLRSMALTPTRMHSSLSDA